MENEGFAKKNKNDDVAKGPVIERLCKKCGHDEMSYAAVQLRSADEGQTVFFTCVKCKYVTCILSYVFKKISISSKIFLTV